jgi:hypothetical protein
VGWCPESRGKAKWRNLPVGWKQANTKPPTTAATGGLRHGEATKRSEPQPDLAPVPLGELIHRWVRRAIETAVHEELEGALGAAR